MKRLTIEDVERRTQLAYVTRLPTAMPADQILVHNSVRPTRQIGRRGFRAWLSPRDHAERYAPCACGWARELGGHFRSDGWR